MENSYFEKKKKEGLIFTFHNMNPLKDYVSIEPKATSAQPVVSDDYLYWSRLSGRYRTFEEQKEFISSGCVDKDCRLSAAV
jgi:hypothetical protein